MPKNATPARTLDMMVDAQIGELVRSDSAGGSPTDAISALDMTAEQMALLTLDHDMQNVLITLGIIKEKVNLFETFTRSLHSQITALRSSVGK